jgi:hypothetical protein
MFIVQVRDLEEGNGALWSNVRNSDCSTREEALKLMRKFRRRDDEAPRYGDVLTMYRVVEVGSDAYYSQPTDALEY